MSTSAQSSTLDRLLRLTPHLISLLSTRSDLPAKDLVAALNRLDRCLIDLRRTSPPTSSLLWIDDVVAALDAALHYLRHPPPPSTLSSTPRLSRTPRPSIATLFSAAPSTRSSRQPSLSSVSERLRFSVSKILTSTSSSPPPPHVHVFHSATRVVNEWLTAVQATHHDFTLDETQSWISLSDALPPLPHQYAPCRDTLYTSARDALLAASLPDQDSGSRPNAIGLIGPHGVGKTMLATELVQDVDVCHNFADGVAWVQLGPDINDEELADQLIRCVDTIVAGDFRSSVRYCPSLQSIVSRASRLLRQVSSLVVVDDVSGPRAQRAFDIVISALGASSVALFTAPVDEDDRTGETLSLSRVNSYAKLFVEPLEPNSYEAHAIFRNWLSTSKSTDASESLTAHLKEQTRIVAACHGLPLPIAMSAGFLSKFPGDWHILAETLVLSKSSEETIATIMSLLLKKGGARLEKQLRAIACLPYGVWVSLSALADLWGMDYRLIKLSARRLGRLCFGEYRLGDSSDESRVRFHWQILKYCHKVTNPAEITAVNCKMLANVARRKTANGKTNRLKSDYSPWWAACVTDKYMCRRLHWHMARANSMAQLNDLICDFQWICQRLERDGLLGIHNEFKLATAYEERVGNSAKALGIQQVFLAIQKASKLRKYDSLEMGALPTFLISRLTDHELSNPFCKEFLASVYEGARRPWLRPVQTVEAVTLSPSMSLDSFERDAFTYQANCLAATSTGKIVCGDKLGNIYVYDPASGKKVTSWPSSQVEGHPQSRGVGALATMQDFVLSGHFNGRLFLRSIRTGRSELLHSSDKVLDKITFISATESGIVAVGSHTGKLFVLKTVQGFGSTVKRIDLEGHCDVVTSLHVFPDGRRIASSSCDGFAAIWVLRSSGHQRISLNGHKPDVGHKENYITTFAAVAGGKRLLSSCRGGVVSIWNTSNGDCLWTQRFGFEFSRSLSLQSYGKQLFAWAGADSGRAGRILNVGHPYLVTRGGSPQNLIIIATGSGGEILVAVNTEKTVSSWLELWHPSTQRIFVAVSYDDGNLGAYELVTSLK